MEKNYFVVIIHFIKSFIYSKMLNIYTVPGSQYNKKASDLFSYRKNNLSIDWKYSFYYI
jgi:hypothetical protein